MRALFVVIGFLVAMRIADAQNVGIGIDTPESKLHVAGEIRGDNLILNSLQDNVLQVGNFSAIEQHINDFMYPTGETGWQSFTATQDGTTLGFCVYMSNPGGVTLVKLYAGEGVTSNELFSQNVSLTATSGWVTFPDMPVTIQSGQLYSIWFNNVQSMGMSNIDLYPGGKFKTYTEWDLCFKIIISSEPELIIGGSDAIRLSMPQQGSVINVNGHLQGDEISAANKLGIGITADYPLSIRHDEYMRVMGIYNMQEDLQWRWLLEESKLMLAPSNNTLTVISFQQNGQVGIGTTSPQSVLHLSKSTENNGANDILRVENTGSGGAGIRFKNSAISQNLWQCYVSTDGKFKVGREAIADYLTIQQNGNVGIGTSTPEKSLHVQGDVKVTGSIISDPVLAPLLMNGWANYGSGFANAGYYKDKEGVVHLRGLIKNGNVEQIMALPVGFRPPGSVIFTVVSGAGFARIDVHSNGNVSLVGPYDDSYVSLNGILFRVD